MDGNDIASNDSTEECTTTESFADHSITDGSKLIQRTYYRLAAEHTEYEPAESFFDDLESAFIWTYLATTEETGVPEHVETAIDDARVLTASEFEDQPEADLRTDVVPTFYQHLAGFHCAYRD